MKRSLAAILALGVLLVPGASANHDPIHSACLNKIGKIESAWHTSGTKQQRLDRVHAEIHRVTLCESQPAPPPPPPPIPPPPPPPPPMPQGDNLPNPLFHALNVGLTYYIDAVNGNDTTGDGSTGNPWKTVQKANNFLRDTATWPTNQDVVIKMRSGTYKATSGSFTLTIDFTAGARSPNVNRWLIWEPDAGHEGAVIIEQPNGTEAPKGSVTLTNGTGCNFISFRGIELYGGDERRGSIGNGNSIGLYLQGDNNDNVEFLYGEIHGYQVSGNGVSQSSAQAIQVEGAAANGFVLGYSKIYDIGTTTLTSDFQEHGGYIQGTNPFIINNLWWNIVNGYDLQFFSGSAGDGALIVHNTFVDAEASGMVLSGNLAYTIRNNIFAHHTGRGSSSYGIEFVPNGSGAGTGTVDYALYFNNQGGNRELSPSGWTFTHETQADPLFVNSGADNYRLQSGSPAIGFTDTTYSPPFDLDGNARPPGAEDAGAYEFVTGGGLTWHGRGTP